MVTLMVARLPKLVARMLLGGMLCHLASRVLLDACKGILYYRVLLICSH